MVDIQRNFLKRLLNSKAGMVVSAFRRIQTLPEKKNMETYGKATKFERGLSAFVERITRQSFNSFRSCLEEGQAMKKRAVVTLINTTEGGQKKLYNRWVSITERTKLMNECKEVANIFASLNFSLKSVSDNAFLENKDGSLKEKALLQLFRNLNANLANSFKQWRNINQIEKMRERMGMNEKGAAVKTL